jgi:hypothetical protein
MHLFYANTPLSFPASFGSNSGSSNQMQYGRVGKMLNIVERWDLTERPQTAGGNSTEWHSVVG